MGFVFKRLMDGYGLLKIDLTCRGISCNKATMSWVRIEDKT
jgi:hypothetical protein